MRFSASSRTSWKLHGARSLTYRSLFTLAQTASVCSAFSIHQTISQHQQRPTAFCSKYCRSHAARIPGSRGLSVVSSFPAAAAQQTADETIMTTDALQIVNAAIQAVDPVNSVQARLQLVSRSTLRLGTADDGTDYNLQEYDKVVIVAFGKASSAMATAVVNRVLESSHVPVISGLVIIKDNHATASELATLQAHNVQVVAASHPVPDERSAAASKQLVQLVKESASPTTLVLACISGGGSSLFCAPHHSLSLQDLQATNQALLQSGWSIQDMNVVRKRLEQGKGGRLAQAACPSVTASLILSDVLGDPLDLIASGPTVPDTSTWADAWTLVQGLPPDALPVAVMQLLQDGVDGKVPDSPSADHEAFSKCTNCLVGNNAVAVTAAANKAQALGYNPVILGTQLEGEANQVAKVFVGLAQHLQQADEIGFSMTKLPAALIAGGETTVSIPADSTGKGGRNQELALAAAAAMKTSKLRNVILASVGTDGTDGPTDAAGAVVDGGTIDRLGASASDALQRHDAYHYLDQTDADGHSPLVKTGPTGTNVADVCVILIRK